MKIESEAIRRPELLTTEQAAEHLSVQTSTLHTWRCTKQVVIPFVKIGAIRYRRTDLALLRQH